MSTGGGGGGGASRRGFHGLERFFVRGGFDTSALDAPPNQTSDYTPLRSFREPRETRKGVLFYILFAVCLFTLSISSRNSAVPSSASLSFLCSAFACSPNPPIETRSHTQHTNKHTRARAKGFLFRTGLPWQMIPERRRAMVEWSDSERKGIP